MTEFDTDILLASYNGEEFLAELLASLDRQTDQNWRLVARDDGSEDRSVAILKDWGRDKGNRFLLLNEGPKRLGASGNFNALLTACKARYFLPCDQDDVWLEDKVERLRADIRNEEEVVGAATPVIVHTDLIVVDAELRQIAESFWDYQRVRMVPDRHPWKLLALQNVVTGCAMIGNAALLRAALPIPDAAIVHDWWLALVCALQGRLKLNETPSVRYRQHGDNELGAQKWTTFRLVKLALATPLSPLQRPRQVLAETQAQAGVALGRLEPRLSAEQVQFLKGYSQLREANFLERRIFAFRHGLSYKTIVRDIGLYAAL